MRWAPVALATGSLLVAAGLAAYVAAIRPWHLRWGATEKETRRPMPGDDEVPRPWLNATRAVGIRARPAEIWPWLVQMGYGRAGFYSYDWIDNRGVPSADRIVPELQHLQVGDVVPTGPNGRGFTVADMEPARSLLLVIREEFARISFAAVLEPVHEWETRLVTRTRVAFRRTLPPLLYYLVFDPGDFVMMRKMMLGIKQRAEDLAGAGQRYGRGVTAITVSCNEGLVQRRARKSDGGHSGKRRPGKIAAPLARKAREAT